MIYFIADTHFSEENIMRYENRPFIDVTEMNDEMLRRWNSVVNQDDEVYVLGDFGADGQEKSILNQLNGKKYLIKGNHDAKFNDYYREAGFRDFWILSHEPLYVNRNMPYANLFGHVHDSPIIKTYSKHHYCVSVERINYTPISLDDIISVLQSDTKSSKIQ